MDSKIKGLLNSDKVILHIDTQDYGVLHEALIKLGFDGKLPLNGHGGYDRKTPHEEWTNYQPLEKSYPISTTDGSMIQFEPCYELGNTCYSRVEDCPVGEEIVRELLKRNLRIAVFDYDSLKIRALLIEKD